MKELKSELKSLQIALIPQIHSDTSDPQIHSNHSDTTG